MHIKKLYKLLKKNRKELKQKIECILKDKQIEQSIKKDYLSELKIYLDNIKEIQNEDIEIIYKNIRIWEKSEKIIFWVEF